MEKLVQRLVLISAIVIIVGSPIPLSGGNLPGQNSVIATAVATNSNLLDLTTGSAVVAGPDSIRLTNLSFNGNRYNATITLRLDGTWTVSNVETLPLMSWVAQEGVIRGNTTSTCSFLLPDGNIRTYFMAEGNFVFAESTDGKDLSQTTTITISGSTSQTFISNPAVLLLKNGSYLMVYEESTNPPPEQGDRTLFAATSTDGIQFGSPLQLPSSSVDLSPTGTIFQSVPDLVELSDGTIVLFYVANGTSIASMRSSDNGLTWSQDIGYRLGTAAYGTTSLSAAYVDPDIVLEPSGKFTMYLAYSEFETECGGLGCQRFRIAHSNDGLNFELEQEDILIPDEGASGLVDPDVYQTPDGKWHMLYGEIKDGGIDLRHALYE